MTSLTMEVAKAAGVKPRDAERSKNFFALGLVSWLYSRPVEATLEWIEKRSPAAPWCSTPTPGPSRRATTSARRPSCSRSTTRSARPPSSPASTPTSPATPPWPGGSSPPRTRRTCPLFLGSYPITPASDILHELSKHKHFGVRTVQAEDEIAGVGAAIGAAFGGSLGVTTTSGPGVDLKSESIGLAVSLELPLLVIDIQRGGPSTGLPTKTEQSDLLHAMYGRHGEAPVPIVAPMTPVALLRRGHRGGPHRRQVPDPGDRALRRLPGQRGRAVAAARPGHAARPPRGVRHRDQPHRRRRHRRRSGPTSATRRPWPGPGPCPARPGLEHRIGGLEKAGRLGQRLLRPGQPRAHGPPARRQGGRHRQGHPAARGRRPRRHGGAPVLVLGWGSTFGAIAAGVRRVRARGLSVAHAHLRHLNPFPPNLGEVLRAYDKVLVPEVNLGQLAKLVRAEFLVDARTLSQGPGRALPGRGDRGGRARDARRRPRAPPSTKRTWPADDRHRRSRSRPARTGPRTRRSAGARAAATTRSWPPCRCSCPTSACGARTPCSCRASAARRASRTT